MTTPENLNLQTEMLEPFCRTLKELALPFYESANIKISTVGSANGIGFATTYGRPKSSDFY